MIKKLLAIRLKANFLASLSGKDKNGNAKPISGGKVVGFTLLYAFLVLTFAGFSFSMSMGMGMFLIPGGLSDYYYGLFSLIIFTVLFFLSIFETKSELFECKDNDILLALPIRSSDIVISRIFTVLSINYGITAVLMVPVIISFCIWGGSPLGIVGGIILMLTVPLLATALASGAGYLVAMISRKIKNKTLITIFGSLLFLGVYFVVYFGLLSEFETFMENGEEMMGSLKANFSFLGAIGSVALLSPLPLVIYLGAVAVGSFVAVYLISRNYRRIVTESTGSAKKVYKAREISRSSAFLALTRKELSRFFSSANYILNGAIGALFAVALAVFALIGGASLDASAVEIEGEIIDLTGILEPGGIVALLFCFLMNTISASALSLEGENMWMLKSLPVSEKQVLLAKTVPHILVNAPLSSVCGLMMAIGLDVSPVYYVFYILTPFAANVMFAFLGLLLNVAFPKFSFINEAQVVKQSLAVFLTMMIGMLYSVGVFIAGMIFGLLGFGVFCSAVVLAVTLILILCFYLILTGPAARRLSRLSAA